MIGVGDNNDNSIYFWRCVFTFMIITLHFNGKGAGWYIAVEFFYLVSGYLVAKDVSKYRNAGDWLRKKVKKLYPMYIVAFFECFLASCIMQGKGIKDSIYFLLDRFTEIFGIQMLGFRTADFLNMVAWYVQAYVFVGLIIFALLKLNWDLFIYLIGPIGIMGFGGYIFRNYNCLDVWMQEYNYVPVPVMLAFFVMSIGVELYVINEQYVPSRGGSLLEHSVEWMLFSFVIVWSYFYRWSPCDFLLVIFLSVGVLFAFRPHRNVWYSNRIIKKISAMTYCIYVNHWFFAGYIFQAFFTDEHGNLSVYIFYLVVEVLYSVLIYMLFIRIERYIQKFKQKFSNRKNLIVVENLKCSIDELDEENCNE